MKTNSFFRQYRLKNNDICLKFVTYSKVILVILVYFIILLIIFKPITYIRIMNQKGFATYQSRHEVIDTKARLDTILGKYPMPIDGEIVSKYNDSIPGVIIKSRNENKDVKSMHNGIVEEIGNNNEYGNYIKIKHINLSEVFYTYYGNLDSINVKEGDIIKSRKAIGKISENSRLVLVIKDKDDINYYNPLEKLILY